MRTLIFPFRKICSALPAVALLSGGIVLSASAAPTGGQQLGPVSSKNAAIVVPDIALTLPGSEGQAGDSLYLSTPGSLAPGSDAPPSDAPASSVTRPGVVKPLVPLLPPGTDPDSSTPVTLDNPGIPARALESYRLAASLINSADPGCNIDWALIAAIGRVESNHARFGGNQLDSGAVAQPGIIGIALDGTNETARITDTDGGLLDRDTTFDRAVGPMQFIPGTWRAAGVDADGDGVKNPQDMADAATATAVYLCSGAGDLSTAGDLRSAVLRYNHSDSYVQLVTSIAAAYRHGVRALPASDLAPAASSTPSATSSSAAAASPDSSPEAGRAAVGSTRSTTTTSSTTTTATAPRTTTRAPAPGTTTTTAPRTSTTTAPRTTTTTTTAPAPRTTTTTTTAPRTTTTTTTAPAPRTTTTTTTPAPTTTTTSSSGSGSSGSGSSGSGSSGSGSSGSGSSGSDDSDSDSSGSGSSGSGSG